MSRKLKSFNGFTGKKTHSDKVPRIIAIVLVGFMFSSCEGGIPAEINDTNGREGLSKESIFGSGGISFGGNDTQQIPGGGIGVNSYLWRATLDTMSVWPITSADPFGGVIITDWYAPPSTPNERFKLNIFILDRALRADGVRVSVFRQKKTNGNDWQDAPVQNSTKIKLEDAILTRARQFRNRDGQQ
jgi:hypothetical protein